jgi:hypothetical protein
VAFTILSLTRIVGCSATDHKCQCSFSICHWLILEGLGPIYSTSRLNHTYCTSDYVQLHVGLVAAAGEKLSKKRYNLLRGAKFF